MNKLLSILNEAAERLQRSGTAGALASARRDGGLATHLRRRGDLIASLPDKISVVDCSDEGLRGRVLGSIEPMVQAARDAITSSQGDRGEALMSLLGGNPGKNELQLYVEELRRSLEAS